MKDRLRWGVLTIGTALGNAHFTNREVQNQPSKHNPGTFPACSSHFGRLKIREVRGFFIGSKLHDDCVDPFSPKQRRGKIGLKDSSGDVLMSALRRRKPDAH